MNFDYNNLDGNWSIMNASNGAANRKGNNNSHLQYGSADPISFPSSHMVRKVEQNFMEISLLQGKVI
jgi:hypothetical protein